MSTIFDSGLLLLTSDFRKTLVSNQKYTNGETEQIRQALVHFRYTNLNDQDKLLLAHDLAYIFSKEFYDFENGCLSPERSSFFRSDESLLFFADYLQYFSFISSSYKRPPISDTILSDISSPDSRKSLFKMLREPLSPYLFVTFIHNLIDTINLGTTDQDSSSIENEMCRQLMINAKEFSQMDKFIELHKELLNKIKGQYRKAKITVTKDMENTYTFFFAHTFFQTIVYPSQQCQDPTFKEMRKGIFKILHTDSKQMEPLISQYSCEKDLLSYHTYLYQRAMCIEQNDSWIHPAEEKKIFLYPAQLRLTIMSKKIGSLMGDGFKPIGNTVIIVIIPTDQEKAKNITVTFQYSNKTYTKKIIDGVVDCVFPCFKDVPLEISFTYKNKKNNKDTIVINSLNDPAENELMKEVKIGKNNVSIVVNQKFYSHDKPLDNLIVHLNVNPKNLFDFVADTFIHKYLAMNSNFIYVHRGEEEFEDDNDDDSDPSKNLFQSTNKLRISQDISGRAFPIDYWLFLIDIAMKYSIPSSYFFTRLASKFDKLWCTSQAYINMYCIILFNLFFAINNSEHTKEEEEFFTNTMKAIREKCIRLLMDQLAKPEIYQRPSITSLILLLSLSNEKDSNDLGDVLKTIFVSSMNNINISIYNRLIYIESDKECTSFDLFKKISPSNKPEFPEGPNHLPLCQVDVESLRNALDLILYRSKSISTFYLESFLPNFANIGDNIMNDLMKIAIQIANAFNNIDPIPDQKILVYFVTVYQQLYQIYRKPETLNPAVLFNDSIENWMYDISSSMIELIERSIKLDTFVKRSDKTRVSDSFFEIFLFFRQGFDFITSLNFTQKEVRDKLFFFLSINSAICSTYIELLLSMTSKQFRASFTPQQPMIVPVTVRQQQPKPKSPFPSWCPDITEARLLSFENICIMINNVASIRLKWFKYIVIYDKYLPNQPQIQVALKATTARRSVKNDTNLLLNENESNEDVEENKDTFKDPCLKLTSKVNFMFNFLRLDLTYEVYALLSKKMWDSSLLNTAKQLRENFFAERSNRVDEDNISTVFDRILEIFKDKVEKMKDNLQNSLHIKCLPQLFRGLEDAIFESMIPLAFSIKSKNVFTGLVKKIDELNMEVFNFIEKDGFGMEIVNRCIKSMRLLPYIRGFMGLSAKELEEQLKIEKANFNGDYTNIILLSILVQVAAAVPLPKAVNPIYTFISLE